MRKSLFINTKPPYSYQACKDALDAAMVGAAFGMPIGLLFLGEGIYQLTANQTPDPQWHKKTAPIFEALELYDINDIYVIKQDLLDRQLSHTDFIIPIHVLDASALPELLSQYDHFLNF